MTTKITISAGDVQLEATLNDSDTAHRIVEALPLEASGNWWGDEIYFSIPVDCDTASDARSEFAVGELGYWPPGNAFCIFFGPTPASPDQTPRMANPGNPIGMTDSDPEIYRSIVQGSTIHIDIAS